MVWPWCMAWCIQVEKKPRNFRIDRLVRTLIACIFLAERCPHILCSRYYPLFDATDAVQGGTHIQRKDGRAIRFGRGRVVIDDVADLLAAVSAHYPVMSIERRLRAVNDLCFNWDTRQRKLGLT